MAKLGPIKKLIFSGQWFSTHENHVAAQMFSQHAYPRLPAGRLKLRSKPRTNTRPFFTLLLRNSQNGSNKIHIHQSMIKWIK